MTLKDYILRWQEIYDKNQSRPTTYAAHGYIFKNHILPGLGEVQLSELTVEQVGDFLEERRRFGGHRPESPEYPGLGEHTMRHIHRLLQQCLDQAIREGLIAENPARAFHYPKPKKVSANVLTPAEVEDYLDAAERLGHLPMFLLALTVGLRQGELITLKWSDLDVKEQTLTITEKRAVERRELVEYEGGTRIVSLTPEAVELLRLEHTKHPGSPLMFMHPATQRPYSPQMVRRLHNEIIQEARLDHIRFADLRHMTEQELNKRIAEILGSTKNEPGCGRRSGRQYRRTQCVRHSDHLLFLIQHSRYAPNMGYIMGDYEGLRTLLHSGLHIQYMKSSDRQQYLKRRSNRKVRKYFGLSKKGNQYRKVFEYWWTLY